MLALFIVVPQAINEVPSKHWKHSVKIVWWYWHSLVPLFLKEAKKINYLPQRGRDLKNQKLGGSMVQGQIILKRGSWHFSYLIFLRFIIFTFRNYFTLCKIVLCIWRRIIFCYHNFMKKSHSKLSKNEPENIP